MAVQTTDPRTSVQKVRTSSMSLKFFVFFNGAYDIWLQINTNNVAQQ